MTLQSCILVWTRLHHWLNIYRDVQDILAAGFGYEFHLQGYSHTTAYRTSYVKSQGGFSSSESSVKQDGFYFDERIQAYPVHVLCHLPMVKHPYYRGVYVISFCFNIYVPFAPRKLCMYCVLLYMTRLEKIYSFLSFIANAHSCHHT